VGVKATVLALALAACAGGAMRSARVAAPLDQSLFAHDPTGHLDEDKLQAILAAPIELDLPARVGILPVIGASDWRGPSPDYEVPAGAAPLASALRGDGPFALVTETVAIPSGALGMEALREIAARYALRYVVLYREDLKKTSHVNGLATLYATLLGALFLPGQTLTVRGHIEASLFDVKTGLLLFTVRRAVEADRQANVWYPDEKLEALAAELTRRFAPELAGDVRADVARFADAAKLERARRVAAATP
jgi:hypothetical protein